MASSIRSTAFSDLNWLQSAGKLVVLSGLLSGCNSQNIHHYGASHMPAAYTQRHPIVLGHANQTLDVFAGHSSSSLDIRQTETVRAFARDYMEHGQGPLIAYLPTNGSHAGLNAIRHELSRGGAAGRLQIAHYTSNSGTVAPIRLAFAKLQAQVNSHCSYAYEEIVPTNFLENISNREAANFGCAHQKNIAAQINDPRDVVRAREEGPIDSSKRLAGIVKIREDKGANELKVSGKTVEKLLRTPE